MEKILVFSKPPHGTRASDPGGDGGGDESTHLRRTEGCSAGGAWQAADLAEVRLVQLGRRWIWAR